MNHNQKKLPLRVGAIVLCVFAAACAHNDGSFKKSVAADSEMDTSLYGRSVVLNFENGSSLLRTEEQAKLRSIVNNVGPDNVDKIELAVWSDRAFPRKGKSLPKADRDLVDNRIVTVNEFLKTYMNSPSIKVYNMADASNWVARTFKTDDAELKSIFSKDASAPMTREDFNIIARDGAPCKAVIVVVRK